MDVKDNATALQIRESLDSVEACLRDLLGILARKIECYAATPLIAFTQLPPAEPSTLGYRLAQYAQDLLADWENLGRVRSELRGKGFK